MKKNTKWLIPVLLAGLISVSGCNSANDALSKLSEAANNIPNVVSDIAEDPLSAANNIAEAVPGAVSGVLEGAGNIVNEGLGQIGVTGVDGQAVVEAIAEAEDEDDYDLPSFDIYNGYGESGITSAVTQAAETTAPVDDYYSGFDVPPGGYQNGQGHEIEFDVPPGGYQNAVTSTDATTKAPQEVSTPAPSDSNKLPEFDGQPFVTINNNIPYFPAESLSYTEPFEAYSNLDSLGRCGAAFANVCKELMPTGERGSIGSVKPSGWQNAKYDFVDGKYLYNRCHLIGYQLAGENANEKNLITGTRYLNIKGMLPFENWVDDYVDETGNHVLYRVTPVYEGNNLVASGVLMEGYSVEDQGEGIMFCVYCFNVQPDVIIDYKTGSSYAYNNGQAVLPDDGDDEEDAPEVEGMYILNTHTMKFHESSCSLVNSIAENNKATYIGERQDCIEDGYTPCGKCNP